MASCGLERIPKFHVLQTCGNGIGGMGVWKSDWDMKALSL